MTDDDVYRLETMLIAIARLIKAHGKDNALLIDMNPDILAEFDCIKIDYVDKQNSHDCMIRLIKYTSKHHALQ